MAACTCTTPLNNTGLPGCIPTWGVFKKLIAVPKYKADGTLNYIDLTDTLDSAYFTALVNHADATERWYPLPSMKNVEAPKADSILETYNDGSTSFVQEGARSFTGLLVGQNAQYAGQLKAARCTEFGVFAVDKDGNLIGYTNNESGKLYPIPVDKNTWAPIWQIPTDTTIQKIQLNFSFDVNMLDDYLAQITSSDMTGVNLLNLDGLIDIYSTIVSCTTTLLTIKLYTKYGSAVNPIVDHGLLAANFFDVAGGTASRLYNVTTSAAVTITSVTENPDGTYAIAYAAQTSADVLRITPVKAGKAYDNVIANTATVA